MAGEVGAVFALEQLLAPVAVSVVPTQALHIARAELTELAGEDPAVMATLGHRGGAGGAGGHVTAGRQLVMTQLLSHVRRFQIRWV